MLDVNGSYIPARGIRPNHQASKQHASDIAFTRSLLNPVEKVSVES